MKTRTYKKKINGRYYNYERISTKRVGKRVITKDRYLGPVTPVQGKFDDLEKDELEQIKTLWKSHVKTSRIANLIRIQTGRLYKPDTVRKWCTSKFGKRPKNIDPRKKKGGKK